MEDRDRPQILMVTNHGVHEWQITAGLPDTGGQNVYVNELSAAFAKLGFRVTTANRGGYPHPADGSERTGVRTRGDAERIVYLEDSSDEFIRKEDMFSRVEELAHDLARRVATEDAPPVAIISHYWDGARVADLARSELGLDEVPHIWIPHSLGRLKQKNTDPSTWDELRIPERIEVETRLLERLDGVAHTSRAMEESLRDDYGYEGSIFVPPGVDTDRFDPARVRDDHRGVELLGELLGRDAREIEAAPLVTEISRTAATKRKDVLIRGFARVRDDFPTALLAVTIDPTEERLFAELTGLIDELSLTDSVAVLGSVWEYVPSLYGLSAV
ncbi:MAG: glycosyltransferase, partial [Spirochaetota bacterium]